jgi:hypothetical protein
MKKSGVKNCLVLLAIFLTTLPIFAQKQEFSGGKISFSETMWDFGHVPKTGIVSHTYLIKNIGADTLIIVKVRTTCGCTTTPLTQQKLAPNQTTDMKVFFDPRKIVVSEATKKLQVISSDSIYPIAEVEFTAKIGTSSSLVKLTPTEINFDTVTLGAEEMRSIKIENISGEKLFIKLIEGFKENVDLDLKNKTFKPGEKIELVFKLKKDAALGNISSSVTLDFEGTKIARVSIPILGVIVSK